MSARSLILSWSPAFAGILVLLCSPTRVAGGDEMVATNSPAKSARIDFTKDIQPIFEQNCLRCHGSGRSKGGFRLDNYESFLKGGNDGPAIFPGDSTNSPLIKFVARLDPESVMPPEGEGDPLTPEQVALLRTWVDQGAWWGTEEGNEKFSFTLAPAVGYTAVSGNDSKFRQLAWQPDGWRGGVESFELSEQVSPETKYTLSGHALTDDYLARLSIETPQRGFAHFGFEQFRKYDVNTGGYYPGFTPSVFSLDQDLHLDNGRAWVDFGLTLPDWPRLVLGYEYQYRNGEKATLQWGAATDGIEVRNIYPAYKAIDEHTHVLKFDLDYDKGGWLVEDNFRGEWTDSSTRQVNTVLYVINDPSQTSQDNVQQSWHAFQGANTLRLERQFRPWLFASAGYLYSHVSGNADFNLENAVVGQQPVPQYAAQSILLERQSQVGNANLVAGPWRSCTLTLGVQSEWTHESGNLDGIGNVAPDQRTFSSTNIAVTAIDKVVVDESVALRYTRLPFTTLYTEARMQQESLGQSEDVNQELGQSFLRDTDATSDAFDVRAGFDTSPRPWFKLGSYYRWRERSTTYDGAAYDPNDLIVPLPGYPTFITARDLTTQEIETRLVLRPSNWLKTTFTYRWVATDYLTTTKGSPENPTGGETFAGNYDSQIFSLNFTVTPWRRLSLFTTLSYQEVLSKTLPVVTGTNLIVVPYSGDTWTVLLHGRYVLTKKTDLTAGYTFSSSDFQQNNFATGLPLGIDYRMNGFQIGLNSRWTKDLTTKLQYGFYHYAEPSSGGANNFTANAVFVSLNWRLN